jgi:hypothetical protein
MDSLESLAQSPEPRRRFEHLLYLAAQRGDADLVAERLGWGVDPNCAFAKRRTPLIANIHGACPSAATVRALLHYGADPAWTDESGLTALHYAHRKLLRLSARPRRPPRKSPSLDENNQLVLNDTEQADLDTLREECGEQGGEMARVYWKERLRAARRVFNDPEQIEQIVDLLDAEASDCT